MEIRMEVQCDQVDLYPGSCLKPPLVSGMPVFLGSAILKGSEGHMQRTATKDRRKIVDVRRRHVIGASEAEQA